MKPIPILLRFTEDGRILLSKEGSEHCLQIPVRKGLAEKIIRKWLDKKEPQNDQEGKEVH